MHVRKIMQHMRNIYANVHSYTLFIHYLSYLSHKLSLSELCVYTVIRCLGGFTGARCEVTISGQLGSREKGGVSGGVIGVCIVLLILTIAAVFIIWK